MNFLLRKASAADIPRLTELIEKSARAINAAYYTSAEIEAALGIAWTVDQQLIDDQTYWIVEHAEGQLVGCGGWSRRRLLFGKTNGHSPLADELVPGRDAARIRAFFVHPDFTRQGIGRSLLQKCEAEAKAAGFASLELVATLSGEKLYASAGYQAMEVIEIQLGDGITNRCISMRKWLE